MKPDTRKIFAVIMAVVLVFALLASLVGTAFLAL